ncbi:hypothetical protein T4E_4904, partial [Trichinella pseudospiralis]
LLLRIFIMRWIRLTLSVDGVKSYACIVLFLIVLAFNLNIDIYIHIYGIINVFLIGDRLIITYLFGVYNTFIYLRTRKTVFEMAERFLKNLSTFFH